MNNSKRYEKEKANRHRGRHIGGSGNPDYRRGAVQGETKNWNRPMSKYDVMNEAKKGRNEIISKKGFTKGAIEYAKRYRSSLKLYHGNKRCT